MNTYKFVLNYDNNGDARDGAKTLKAYLAANGSPDAASTVKYVGSTVEFVLAGNVSALSFVHALNEGGVVYAVTPLNGSEPLLVPKAVTPSHVVYMKA